ncbi:MAG: hypothetical protein PHX05_08175, partial [Acidobacteriota bacterium]|nr:hypothetical protein [Acidobacteriota bacterium]
RVRKKTDTAAPTTMNAAATHTSVHFLMNDSITQEKEKTLQPAMLSGNFSHLARIGFWLHLPN